MQATDSRDPDREHSGNGSSPPPREEESLLDLLVAMVVLFQQTWADRWALAKAETRLAAKSVGAIALLICCLALVAVLTWALVLGGVAYYALSLGVSWVWVLAALILAQGIMGLLIVLQIRRLSRSLSLPATRRAFARLVEAEPSAGK